MSSKDTILGKLRKAQKPFTDVEPISERTQMTIIEDTSTEALKALFITEAKKLSVHIHEARNESEAMEQLLDLIGDDKQIMAWDSAHIPLKALDETLSKQGITRTDSRDGEVRVGITGVDAVLASTGSLVVTSGDGKPRTASLIPPVHVAVFTLDQMLPNLEAWVKSLRDAGLENFRAKSNAVIISGSSRTADINQELVMGAHGPRDVHAIMIG